MQYITVTDASGTESVRALPETAFEQALLTLALRSAGVLGQVYGYQSGVTFELAHPQEWDTQGRLQGHLTIRKAQSGLASLLATTEVFPVYFWIEDTGTTLEDYSALRVWWEMPANAYGHAQSNTAGTWPVLNLPDAE